MKETNVSVVNKDGEKLFGLCARPDLASDKYSAIILVHGFGVTKEEYGLFDILSKGLSDSGFLVYRFDFSGCGQSEGDYSKVTLSKLKDDLECIVDFVKSQKCVDADRIGILGQSFGTSVVVSLNLSFKAIVLMGAISHPKAIFSKLFQLYDSVYNPSGVSMHKQSDGRVTKVESGFWKDLDNYNLPALIRKVQCPVLFLNGSKDDKLPVSETDDYYSNVGGIKKRVVIEGASHGMKPRRDEALDVVVSWFKKYLLT